MPTLTIQLPGLPPVEHVLRDEAITLGRMKGNSIALDDASVSLSHAKITKLGNDYFLKDLNSTNGTLLNGQSISEARLHDGDQLNFGEVRAVFRLEPATVPATGAPTISPGMAQSVVSPLGAPSAASAPAPMGAATAPTPPAPWSALARSARRGLWPLVIGAAGGVVGLITAGFIVWQMAQTSRDRSGTAGEPATPAPTAARPALVNPSPPLAKEPTEEEDAAPDTRTAPELAQALGAGTVAERRQAARRLSGLVDGVEPAFAALRAALADEDEDVRLWAAIALVNNQQTDPAAVPILLRGLRHPDVACRQLACLSLALYPHDEKGRATALGALREVAAGDRDEGVRRDATTAMRYLAPEAGTP
jgi:hypothetical protein